VHKKTSSTHLPKKTLAHLSSLGSVAVAVTMAILVLLRRLIAAQPSVVPPLTCRYLCPNVLVMKTREIREKDLELSVAWKMLKSLSQLLKLHFAKVKTLLIPSQKLASQSYMVARLQQDDLVKASCQQ
jgi:hypothetical protein